MASRTASPARTAAVAATPLDTATVDAIVAAIATLLDNEATAHTYADKGNGLRQGVYCGGKIKVNGVRYQVGMNVTPIAAK